MVRILSEEATKKLAKYQKDFETYANDGRDWGTSDTADGLITTSIFNNSTGEFIKGNYDGDVLDLYLTVTSESDACEMADICGAIVRASSGDEEDESARLTVLSEMIAMNYKAKEIFGEKHKQFSEIIGYINYIDAKTLFIDYMSTPSEIVDWCKKMSLPYTSATEAARAALAVRNNLSPNLKEILKDIESSIQFDSYVETLNN